MVGGLAAASTKALTKLRCTHGGLPGQDVSDDPSLALLRDAILQDLLYSHIRQNPRGCYLHDGVKF
jgi:hypothetical protein